MQKSLDQKLAAIHADPSGSKEFIIADAKDADMAFGIGAPGRSPEMHAGEVRMRTLAEYREQIRQIVRQGLVAALEDEADFQVVASAGSAEEALSLATRHRPDLILLDLELPGASGVEAIPGLLAASPGTRVLVSRIDGATAIVRAEAITPPTPEEPRL